jgi:hypothetical protein
LWFSSAYQDRRIAEVQGPDVGSSDTDNARIGIDATTTENEPKETLAQQMV